MRSTIPEFNTAHSRTLCQYRTLSSTAHGIAQHMPHHTLAQYRTSYSKCVATYPISVPPVRSSVALASTGHGGPSRSSIANAAASPAHIA
eukprot:2264879-Rhodomonas_salina.2